MYYLSSDCSPLVSASSDDTVRLWDMGYVGRALTDSSSDSSPFVLSPGGVYTAFDYDRMFRIWDVRRHTLTEPGHAVRSISFSFRATHRYSVIRHSQCRPIVIPILQLSLPTRRFRNPCQFLVLPYMRSCRKQAPACLKTSPVPDFLNQGLLGLVCDMAHAGKN